MHSHRASEFIVCPWNGSGWGCGLGQSEGREGGNSQGDGNDDRQCPVAGVVPLVGSWSRLDVRACVRRYTSRIGNGIDCSVARQLVHL